MDEGWFVVVVPNVIRTMKSKRLGEAGHVARMVKNKCVRAFGSKTRTDGPF
jgi:hypothetical protein